MGGRGKGIGDESVMVVREVSTTGGEESGTDWRELSSPNSVLFMTVHIFASKVKIRWRVFTLFRLNMELSLHS